MPKPKVRPSANKADLKALQAAWEIVRVSGDGRREPVKAGAVTVVFAGDRQTRRVRGVASTTYTVRLGATCRPKVMDLKPHDGGQVILGLYRLEGDTLTCSCLTGRWDRGRPKDLTEGHSACVEVLRR